MKKKDRYINEKIRKNLSTMKTFLEFYTEKNNQQNLKYSTNARFSLFLFINWNLCGIFLIIKFLKCPK